MGQLISLSQSSRELGAACRDRAHVSATRFIDVLVGLDRLARRQHRTVPTHQERQAVNDAFWTGLIPALADVEATAGESELARTRVDLQSILNPWLLRSRFWARSWLKPHGYPGDYRMMEWMYDLELDGCADPCQPAVVNLLDGLYKSVHSVQAVWHRRAWFASVIARNARVAGRPVRVLDVACGGSRYVHDVVDRYGADAVAATLFDQDPAALAYAQARLPQATRTASTLICAPVKRLHELLPVPTNGSETRFDVVISTGLFDYLEREPARHLLAHVISLTCPGGTIAICNFSPDDPSRLVKDWIADWQLIYRTSSELAALFPTSCTPALTRSPDSGLLYAQVTV
jgi:SAM-dependent methyltransferase